MHVDEMDDLLMHMNLVSCNDGWWFDHAIYCKYFCEKRERNQFCSVNNFLPYTQHSYYLKKTGKALDQEVQLLDHVTCLFDEDHVVCFVDDCRCIFRSRSCRYCCNVIWLTESQRPGREEEPAADSTRPRCHSCPTERPRCQWTERWCFYYWFETTKRRKCFSPRRDHSL